MVEQKDIYRTAQLLIKQYGKKAQSVANERLQEFLDKGDTKASGVWLAIGCAVDDLAAVSNNKMLH